MNPIEACSSRKILEETSHVFSHKIETEGKPVTNQKNSGRCWLFAILNVMRTSMMKEHNLDEFEFSQAYLFFWDKVCICFIITYMFYYYYIYCFIITYIQLLHATIFFSIGRTLQLFFA